MRERAVRDRRELWTAKMKEKLKTDLKLAKCNRPQKPRPSMKFELRAEGELLRKPAGWPLSKQSAENELLQERAAVNLLKNSCDRLSPPANQAQVADFKSVSHSSTC